MKIGLLVCDHIQADFPDYPVLFKDLLPKYSYDIFNVCEGVFPRSASECNVWIITGSKYSVYDEIDWIIRLKSFVREISNADKYCIGICFGHQMLGEAMGGVVKKSEKGWCVGAHKFEITESEKWMVPYYSSLNLLMSCQDQIITLPKKSKIIAQSPMCSVGIIKIGKKMLGIQGHPEFSANYVKSLIKNRINQIGDETAKIAINSLETPIQSTIVAKWIDNFINQ
jgi:GMP synthase-like glutamine amidotransferase